MITFDNFLQELASQPLLTESVTFQPDHTTKMISSVGDLYKWFSNDYMGKAYTTDGKFSFARFRTSSSLYITETGNYGKSGKTNMYRIYIGQEMDRNGSVNDVISDLKSVDSIVDVMLELEKTGGVKSIRKESIQNTSVDAFNPVMLKNFKSIGSIASKDKINKVQARKIIASGDFDTITHDYQMRDDNYKTSGAINLTYDNITMVLETLDSKNSSVLKQVGSESFNIYVHSNLSYYINRD